jgi:hypothetical protein
VQEYGPQPCAGKYLEAFRYVESKKGEPRA